MCSLLGEAVVAVNHLQDKRLFESWHFEVTLSVVDQCVSLVFLRTHKVDIVRSFFQQALDIELTENEMETLEKCNKNLRLNAE